MQPIEIFLTIGIILCILGMLIILVPDRKFKKNTQKLASTRNGRRYEPYKRKK